MTKKEKTQIASLVFLYIPCKWQRQKNMFLLGSFRDLIMAVTAAID